MRWSTLAAACLFGLLCCLSPVRAAQEDAIAFGRFHALVIGNNDYQHLARLKTAQGDAEATAKLLAERYGFAVTLLKNATREQILGELNRLRAELSADDNLLIYYAGHGTIDRQTNTGFWLPVDAAEDDDLKWIATDDLSRRIKAMAARHVLVVADSCYSGALVRDANVQPKTGGERDEWLRRMTQKRARTAMVSGGLEPVTDQGAGGHSVFANAFLGALNENDEPLEAAGLFQRLRQKVVLNAEQTPQYADIRLADHEGGDFIFVPKGSVVVATAQPRGAAGETRGPSRSAAGQAPVLPAPLPGDVGALFRDCAECPEMVVVPAGKFTMGGPKRPNQSATFEAPEREVVIEKRFAIGRHEVTRSEYSAFVSATKRPVTGGCKRYVRPEYASNDSMHWRNPGYEQEADEPAACISWDDAKAYVAWLADKTGHPYRLPSEAEWEYVARAGSKEKRPFGMAEEALCQHANVHDQASYEAADFDWLPAECNDGHAWTAPVASYPANAFGVFNMLGNVAEWVEDCWNPNYVGAPRTGRPRITGDCTKHVARGGSWAHAGESVTVIEREVGGPFDYQGFRVALSLPD